MLDHVGFANNQKVSKRTRAFIIWAQEISMDTLDFLYIGIAHSLVGGFIRLAYIDNRDVYFSFVVQFFFFVSMGVIATIYVEPKPVANVDALIILTLYGLYISLLLLSFIGSKDKISWMFDSNGKKFFGTIAILNFFYFLLIMGAFS